MINWVESDLGGLDVLVNNAGVMRGPLSAPDAASTSVEELEINLGGAIRMTRLALPLLAAAPPWSRRRRRLGTAGMHSFARKVPASTVAEAIIAGVARGKQQIAIDRSVHSSSSPGRTTHRRPHRPTSVRPPQTAFDPHDRGPAEHRQRCGT